MGGRGCAKRRGEAGLDTLSLQARVISAGGEEDPNKARELFQRVDRPKMAARPCEDPMIADDSAYFEMAAQAPSLISVIGPGNSPGELANSARLLRAAGSLSADEFRLLLGALALKMETANPDYRAFTLSADALREELEGLMTRARELGVPADALAQGARKLAVAQLSGPRCNEEFGGAGRFVEWFNKTLGKRFEAIGGEETVAKASLGAAKAENYFEAGSGQALSDAFQRLRAVRSRPEWSDRLADFLRQFSEFKAAGADIDAFHQKMIVLRGLMQLVPAGGDRDKLAAQAIGILKQGGIEGQYPAEWLLQVRLLSDATIDGRAKLRAAFRESEDAGLSLFAALNP